MASPEKPRDTSPTRTRREFLWGFVAGGGAVTSSVAALGSAVELTTPPSLLKTPEARIDHAIKTILYPFLTVSGFVTGFLAWRAYRRSEIAGTPQHDKQTTASYPLDVPGPTGQMRKDIDGILEEVEF